MFASGARVGRYEIVKKLGEGGMGTVFLALEREPDTLREHAIKIAHPGAPATVHQRFRQEVRVTLRLQHPHLITTFDTGVHDEGGQSVPYLVMEYLDGETLADALHKYVKRREAMPLPEWLDFARQIAAGLSSAHEKSIVHRDLKPSNIFVCRTSATTLVKLIDFGLALVQRETLVEDAGPTMLSPPYAPPEQWEDPSSVGPAADVYAFGCVLFELATGEPPLGLDGNLRQAHAVKAAPNLNKIRKKRHPNAASLPRHLAEIVHRMLAKDPQDRPLLEEVINVLNLPDEPPRPPWRILAWLLLGLGVLGLAGVAVAKIVIKDEVRKCSSPRDCALDQSCSRITGQCEATGRITPLPCKVENAFEPCRSGITVLDNRWVICRQTTFPESSEKCDGVDNDCNGIVDDRLERTEPCAVAGAKGECAARASWVCNGAAGWQCRPAQPQVEAASGCDGKDNDCDGVVDDDLSTGSPCKVGKGECARVARIQCINGSPKCVAGAPSSEVCDGKDNDCDGSVDDGISAGQFCLTGVGECVKSAKMQCIGGSLRCVAGVPSFEICDGKDNDCDGSVDNGVSAGQSCLVGIGECAKSAKMQCIEGSLKCVAGAPSSEICDGNDNDCDGSVDNGVPAGQSCLAGVGECAKSAKTQCIDGSLKCVAGAPSSEICDGKDNDCNGTSDDGIFPGASCPSTSRGECARNAKMECRSGKLECVDAPPSIESCDGKDNDCDGLTDEIKICEKVEGAAL